MQESILSIGNLKIVMSFISSGKAIFGGLGVVCGVVSVFACKKDDIVVVFSVFACKKDDIVCWCFFRCVTLNPKGGPESPVRLCWGRVFQSQRSFLVGNSSALVLEDVGDYEVVEQATDKTLNGFQRKVRQNVGKSMFSPAYRNNLKHLWPPKICVVNIPNVLLRVSL